MMRYCSLFSGSSGNATYVAAGNGGVLIDAGVSAKRIENALRAREIDPKSIRAILVTHEHSDHVSGLKVLCSRYGWPILASEGTLDALVTDNKISAEQDLFVIQPGQRVTVAGMQVQAFDVPHDSRHCLGYRLDSEDGRAVAIATDMGYLADTVMEAIRGCQTVHIESNHDPEMLRCGPYPYYLKERIAGRGGHLANDICAQALPVLLESGATRFTLAHISRENNTPTLAEETSCRALTAAGAVRGRDYLLDTASPEGEKPITLF